MGRTPANDDKQSDNKQTRRRGAELESAILDAACEQLIAEGYEHFTVDTVAARAGPASLCSTAAGRPGKTCCAPPSATVVPPIVGPYPTPALSAATVSRCSPRPTPTATPWLPWRACSAAITTRRVPLRPSYATSSEANAALLSKRSSTVPSIEVRSTRPGSPPDYRSPLRPVPSRNDDDAQTRPRPRPAPGRRRHLHPARHHTTWYWAQPQTSWATLTMSSSLATSSS
jgi:Bacterial regulatory proteins, tetR family